MIGVREAGRRDGARHRDVGAGGQHVGVMLGQTRDDRHHLFGGLARAEHRLGGAATQRPVVIDLREAQVFVGQPAQSAHRRVHVEPPGAHVVEDPANGFPIHWRSAA